MLLTIEDFSTGINRVIFGLEKSPLYAWDMRNFDLDQYGRLVKRLGYTRFNATALSGTQTINSLFAYFNLTNNTREIIAILANGALVRVDDTGAGGTPAAGIATTTRDLQGVVLRDYLYHTLGTQYLRVFYPNFTFDSGEAGPPTFTPTLTAGTGGSLTSSQWYRYRFTYAITTISGNTPAVAVESLPRTSTKTDQTFDIQLSSTQNRVTIGSLSASSASLVDRTRIYRSTGQATRAALDTVETYFVAQQDDATTSYTDDIADSALGGLLDTYDHNRLGQTVLTSTNRLRGIAVYNDRIWVSKDIENFVICSKRLAQDTYLGVVGDAIPYAFPAANQISVGRGSGDNITAMTVFRGALLIFKRYSTWIISGATDPNNPPADMDGPRLLFGDVGCFADRSLANSGNRITWLSHRGVYTYDGSELKFIGEPIQPIVSAATQTNQMEAYGLAVDRYNEYWLAINDAEITATQDRIFKYDFYRGYWRSDVIPSTITCLATLIPQTTAQTPFVLAGSDNESFIYRLLNGTTDAVAGVATEITARWQSHYLPLSIYRGQVMLANRISRKKAREIIINSTLSSDTNLRPRFTNLLESDNGATSTTFTITPNSRTDILSYRVSGLHIGRDIRIRTTMDTRAGDATNTDATLNAIVINFDDSSTL